MTRLRFLTLAVGLWGGACLGVRAADPTDATAANADQAENNYYWQGTQLYNLGRLGEAFDSFEKAIQKKQNTKESEAYLLQIRQEIVNNAKKRESERQTLNYGGALPDTALNVVYVQKDHIRVTIQAKYLFEDNTSAFKVAAMDVLGRLKDILEQQSESRVELNFIDEIDNTPWARDVNAERELAVFGLLNLKRLEQPSAS